jgi:uncharacterized membrane protein
MGGVLVLAAGIEPVFTDRDYTVLDPILAIPFAITAIVMTLVVAVLVLHPPVPEHAER